MKFLLDENVSHEVARILRSMGHDVRTAPEEGILGQPDEYVFHAAKAGDRTLITRDHHFSNPVRFPTAETAGILFVRADRFTSEEEAALVAKAVQKLGEGIRGALVTISPQRITRL